MTQTCKTVNIVSEVSADNPGGFIIINESDFDAETMKLFGNEEAKEPGKVPADPVGDPVIAPTVDPTVDPTAVPGIVLPPWAAK